MGRKDQLINEIIALVEEHDIALVEDHKATRERKRIERQLEHEGLTNPSSAVAMCAENVRIHEILLHAQSSRLYWARVENDLLIACRELRTVHQAGNPPSTTESA